MSNFKQISEQIERAKQRISSLLSSDIAIDYDIYAIFPNDREEKLLFKDNLFRNSIYKDVPNKEDKKNMFYERFCNNLDAITSRSDIAVATVKIRKAYPNVKNQSLGEEKIVFMQAYANMQPTTFLPQQQIIKEPVLQKIEKQPTAEEAELQQQKQKENDMNNSQERIIMEALGQIFIGQSGLGDISEKQGSFGTLFQIQKKTMENKFEQELLKKEMDDLKKELAEAKRYISELERDNEKQENQIEKLTDELEEYRQINPKRNLVSGILGQVFSQAAVSIAKQSKYGALLGFTDDEQPTEQIVSQQAEQAEQTEPKSSMEIIEEESEQENQTQIVIDGVQ